MPVDALNLDEKLKSNFSEKNKTESNMHAPPYEPCMDLSGVPTCTETLLRHRLRMTCHCHTHTAPNLSIRKQLDKLSDCFTYWNINVDCFLEILLNSKLFGSLMLNFHSFIHVTSTPFCAEQLEWN